VRRLRDGEVACTNCGLIVAVDPFNPVEGLELFDGDEDSEYVGGRLIYPSELSNMAVWGNNLGSSGKGLPARLAELHEESSERAIERGLKRLLLKRVYFPFNAEGRVSADGAARLALAKLRELERRKIPTRRDLEKIVEEVAAQLNLQPRKKGRGRRRKLTDEQIKELIEMRRAGASYPEIARRFGISVMAAFKYVRAYTNSLKLHQKV